MANERSEIESEVTKDIERRLGMSIPCAIAHLRNIKILTDCVKHVAQNSAVFRRKAVSTLENWDSVRSIHLDVRSNKH